MTLRWKIAQTLEIRWWQNYLKNKETTNYLAAKRDYWQKVLNILQIDIHPNEQILDAGCGPSGIFMILNSCSVNAIDPLLDQYEKNLPHFEKAAYPWVQFYNQSLEKFTIHASYDKVFCLNAINHVADLDLCLDKLVEAIGKNGQLIISIDVHKNKWLKLIFRTFPGDILHPHQHDLKDYVKMLENRECKIVKKVNMKPGRIFDYYCLVVEGGEKV